jgi:hypothetical protein
VNKPNTESQVPRFLSYEENFKEDGEGEEELKWGRDCEGRGRDGGAGRKEGIRGGYDQAWKCHRGTRSFYN